MHVDDVRLLELPEQDVGGLRLGSVAIFLGERMVMS